MDLLKYTASGIIVATVAVAGFSATADAQFFKGKRVNIIINYGAGGNTDIQGRMVMRHMKKYIKGNPRLVFRHVSGAGGVVGANFLGEAGKKNGTMMGVFTIPIMAQVMKTPELRVDLSAFHYVGAVGQQTIGHIRKDAIPGKTIKTYKDLISNEGHAIRTGGHGPTSSKDLRTRLLFQAMKIPLKHVTGYKSGGKIRAAILKNELDMTADSLAGYYGRVVAQLIKPGISVPIWHIGMPGPNNTILHSPTVPKNIPSFQAVYEEKFGKGARPSPMIWNAIRTIGASREMLRILVFRKGSNPKAVAEMRAAWDKTMVDKEFLKDYAKVNGSAFTGKSGADAQKYVKTIVNVPKDLEKFLLAYADAARG
jgi:tripartite-type tricarboxylate transporter receptor subunit TctC